VRGQDRKNKRFISPKRFLLQHTQVHLAVVCIEDLLKCDTTAYNTIMEISIRFLITILYDTACVNVVVFTLCRESGEVQIRYKIPHRGMH
jgi:hypothetical protein